MEKHVLLDHTGQPIKKGLDLDPDFFQSPRLLRGKDGSSMAKPYAQHSWVYACVNAIVRNIAQLEIVFTPTSNPDKHEKNHEYIKLMKRPNPYMDGADLIKFTLLSLLLPTTQTQGGQCFWVLEPKREGTINLKRGEIPFEIYPFSDECIEARQDEQKNLVGWNLRLPNGTKLEYKLHEIIRFKLINPYDLTKGLSPLASAKLSIEGDIKSDALNNRFFDNNASLGGVLTTEKILADQQIKQLADSWNQQYSGVSHAGKTAILHSGLKYEQMAKTHMEMQYMEQKAWNVDVIRAVYGVPKFAIGLYEDLNFATAEAAKKFFWEETILPYCREFWSTLNANAIQYLDGGDKWVGTFDYSNVEALQDKYKDKILTWAQMVDRGTPMDRAAKLLRIPLDTKDAEYMTWPLVKGQVVNIETGEAIGAPELPPEDPKADGGKKPIPPVKPPAKKPKKDMEEEAAKPYETLDTLNSWIKEVEDEQKEMDAFWLDYVVKVLDPGEKELEPIITSYFFEQRNIIQDAIDAWARSEKSVGEVITKAKKTPKADDLLPDKGKEDTKLGKKVEPTYKKQVAADTAKMQQEIGDLLNWEVESPEAKKLVADRIKFLKKINNTTFRIAGKLIGAVVEQSVNNNWTVAKTAKELKKAVSKVYDLRTKQAKTIARTETGAISSRTRYLIMESEEISFHKWVSARDGKVRHEHKRGTGDDGVIVALGEIFPNSQLEYPHDQKGDAGQVINCRCMTRAVKKKKED